MCQEVSSHATPLKLSNADAALKPIPQQCHADKPSGKDAAPLPTRDNSRCEDTDPLPAQDNSWCDDAAPLPAQEFTKRQLLWLPILFFVTKKSIQGLGEGSVFASFFWILYESYIIFDHIPFLFTSGLYDSPRFNYLYLSLIMFWGMEACASVVATCSMVGAPKILLYNVLPHTFFIFANYVRKAATSYAFIPDSTGVKKWWIFLQVTFDNTIHGVSLWYHLVHISNISGMEHYPSPLISWLILFTSMVLLTTWVHKKHMSWCHFFNPLLKLLDNVIHAIYCILNVIYCILLSAEGGKEQAFWGIIQGKSIAA